jgi:hypothetical protein
MAENIKIFCVFSLIYFNERCNSQTTCRELRMLFVSRHCEIYNICCFIAKPIQKAYFQQIFIDLLMSLFQKVVFISDEFRNYMFLVFSEIVWMVNVLLAELQHLTNIYVIFFAISGVCSMKS